MSRRSASHLDEDNRLTVLFGDGLGGLQIVQHVTIPKFETSLLVDENRDGSLDLVLGHREEPNVVVLRGDGTGRFANPMPLVAASARFLEMADFDGDGSDDLFVTLENRSVELFFGNGAGGYPSSEPLDLVSNIDFLIEDFDEDGHPDVINTHFSASVYLNRTRFYSCRRGTVNRGAGTVADVVFVQGTSGFGRDRSVVVSPNEPFKLSVEAAPSGGDRFVIYAWSARLLSPQSFRDPGFGLGLTCMPTPLSSPPPRLNPLAIWKTIVGFDEELGTATHPASPAPSCLADVGALGVRGEFFVQGFFLDSAAPNGLVAVTNGVHVISRD